MKRLLLVAVVLLPISASAQTATTSADAFAANLATNLSMSLRESDQLKAQNAELQKQLAASADTIKTQTSDAQTKAAVATQAAAESVALKKQIADLQAQVAGLQKQLSQHN